MEQTASKKTYLLVAAALLALLALTAALSFVDLGPWNFVAAISIAIMKALLVVLFFMEIRSSGQIVWVLATAGLVWLLLLLGGTLADYLSRNASSFSKPAITTQVKSEQEK